MILSFGEKREKMQSEFGAFMAPRTKYEIRRSEYLGLGIGGKMSSETGSFDIFIEQPLAFRPHYVAHQLNAFGPIVFDGRKQ